MRGPDTEAKVVAPGPSRPSPPAWPRRLLYGTNSEGVTCGTGQYEDMKYVAYPRLSEDVRAAAVQIGTKSNPASMSEVADNLDQLHLFGICAKQCPQAGETLRDPEGTPYEFFLNTRSGASPAQAPGWPALRALTVGLAWRSSFPLLPHLQLHQRTVQLLRSQIPQH